MSLSTIELETRLKFLDEASEILGPGREVLKISSHLRYLKDSFLQYREWKAPKVKDPLPSTCSYCFMEFGGPSYSMTVKTSLRPSRNLVKIMQKKASSQQLTGTQIALLTHYQDTRGKKVILRCGTCKKNTEVVLKKMKSDLKPANPHSSCNVSGKVVLQRKIGSVVPPSNSPHLKKKKKKDPFAGLKKAVVLSLKSNNRKM